MFGSMVPGQMWLIQESGPLDVVAMVVHSVMCFINPFYLMGGTMIGMWKAGGLPVPDRKERPEDVSLDFASVLGCWALWAPLVGQGCLSVVLLIAAYRREMAPSVSSRVAALEQQGPSWKDDDVLAEEKRIQSARPDTEACLYRNLHHTYLTEARSVQAVQGISLGIKQGECFGLLGPNGAGKTTTLGCLTGEIRPPTFGEVFVAGHSVLGNDIIKAYQDLGNCPQIDPLFPNLSGRKTLRFFGLMKGVPEARVDQTVDALLQRLGIETKDRDKVTQQYSGGMKRKLSLGIALIGWNSVLFLDEPSAAVDAAGKRLLWQVIKTRSANRTVIMTTHSMEEAEAVCDRIAIQVLGQLRCLGTPLHLKNKYSSGYQVELRLQKAVDGTAKTNASEERADALLKFFTTTISAEARLLEAYDDSFRFQLPRFEKGSLTLGKVFTHLEGAKQLLGIQEYTLTQASLEQVFLRFAREQEMGNDMEQIESMRSNSMPETTQ
jgi:ABC-type multidrug transport system ATPase subunit